MDEEKNEFDIDRSDGDVYPSFSIPDNLYKSIKIQTSMYDKLKPIVDAQRRIYKPYIELQRRIKEMSRTIERITAPLNSIDINEIGKAVSEKIKEIDDLLKEKEEYLWCLDIDILDALEYEEITNSTLEIYVDESLDQYIEDIISDPIYALHASLIRETYEAYKAGYYKLCSFSLFAAFEHVIASWYEGNISEEEISINVKPKARRLYQKIERLTENEQAQRGFIKIFAQSVLRIYKKTFVFFSDELNTELNRNSIAHGFHDYDSITKTDILKLFQLLKASLILKDISLDEFKEK